VSQIDRIKEILGWLKVVFGALIVIDVSLIAWLAQNFGTADVVLLVLAFVAVVAATAGIIVVNRAAYRRMEELGRL